MPRSAPPTLAKGSEEATRGYASALGASPRRSLVSNRSTLTLLLSALLLLGGGLFVLFGLGKVEPAQTGAPLPGSGLGPVAPATVEPDGPGQRSELENAGAMTASQRPEGPARSTVLWPLRVELECVSRSSLPELGDGQRVGAGATARLAGRIVDSRGRGVEATVSFVAGQNLGRVLHCDSEGRLGASDLYAGLDVVEVAGPGIIGSRRELRLRRGSESLLNIGYGRPATVYGTVLGPAENASAAPVVGARVRVDGQQAWTDERGQFYVPAAASGKVLLEIEKTAVEEWSRQFLM